MSQKSENDTDKVLGTIDLNNLETEDYNQLIGGAGLGRDYRPSLNPRRSSILKLTDTEEFAIRERRSSRRVSWAKSCQYKKLLPDGTTVVSSQELNKFEPQPVPQQLPSQKINPAITAATSTNDNVVPISPQSDIALAVNASSAIDELKQKITNKFGEKHLANVLSKFYDPNKNDKDRQTVINTALNKFNDIQLDINDDPLNNMRKLFDIFKVENQREEQTLTTFIKYFNLDPVTEPKLPEGPQKSSSQSRQTKSSAYFAKLDCDETEETPSAIRHRFNSTKMDIEALSALDYSMIDQSPIKLDVIDMDLDDDDDNNDNVPIKGKNEEKEMIKTIHDTTFMKISGENDDKDMVKTIHDTTFMKISSENEDKETGKTIHDTTVMKITDDEQNDRKEMVKTIHDTTLMNISMEDQSNNDDDEIDFGKKTEHQEQKPVPIVDFAQMKMKIQEKLELSLDNDLDLSLSNEEDKHEGEAMDLSLDDETDSVPKIESKIQATNLTLGSEITNEVSKKEVVEGTAIIPKKNEIPIVSTMELRCTSIIESSVISMATNSVPLLKETMNFPTLSLNMDSNPTFTNTNINNNKSSFEIFQETESEKSKFIDETLKLVKDKEETNFGADSLSEKTDNNKECIEELHHITTSVKNEVVNELVDQNTHNDDIKIDIIEITNEQMTENVPQTGYIPTEPLLLGKSATEILMQDDIENQQEHVEDQQMIVDDQKDEKPDDNCEISETNSTGVDQKIEKSEQNVQKSLKIDETSINNNSPITTNNNETSGSLKRSNLDLMKPTISSKVMKMSPPSQQPSTETTTSSNQIIKPSTVAQIHSELSSLSSKIPVPQSIQKQLKQKNFNNNTTTTITTSSISRVIPSRTSTGRYFNTSIKPKVLIPKIQSSSSSSCRISLAPTSNLTSKLDFLQQQPTTATTSNLTNIMVNADNGHHVSNDQNADDNNNDDNSLTSFFSTKSAKNQIRKSLGLSLRDRLLERLNKQQNDNNNNNNNGEEIEITKNITINQSMKSECSNVKEKSLYNLSLDDKTKDQKQNDDDDENEKPSDETSKAIQTEIVESTTLQGKSLNLSLDKTTDQKQLDEQSSKIQTQTEIVESTIQGGKSLNISFDKTTTEQKQLDEQSSKIQTQTEIVESTLKGGKSLNISFDKTTTDQEKKLEETKQLEDEISKQQQTEEHLEIESNLPNEKSTEKIIPEQEENIETMNLNDDVSMESNVEQQQQQVDDVEEYDETERILSPIQMEKSMVEMLSLDINGHVEDLNHDDDDNEEVVDVETNDDESHLIDSNNTTFNITGNFTQMISIVDLEDPIENLEYSVYCKLEQSFDERKIPSEMKMFEFIKKLNYRKLNLRIQSISQDCLVLRYLFSTLELRIHFGSIVKPLRLSTAANANNSKLKDDNDDQIEIREIVAMDLISLINDGKPLPKFLMRGREDRPLHNGDRFILEYNEEHRPFLNLAQDYILTHFEENRNYFKRKFQNTSKLEELIKEISLIVTPAKKLAIELRNLISREFLRILPQDQVPDGKFGIAVSILGVRRPIELWMIFDYLKYPDEVIYPKIIIPDEDRFLYPLEEFSAGLKLIKPRSYYYLTNLINGAKLFILAMINVMKQEQKWQKQAQEIRALSKHELRIE